MDGTILCGAGGPWRAPLVAPIVSGYRTADRPDHEGVDLGADRGTPVRAAAAGVVVTSTCNASLAGRAYSCDVDGSPTVLGCGWYVDVRHPGGVVTRYCHLLRQPTVAVGESVVAGQLLGYVGSSGNSSGPHLHFEVRPEGQGPTTDPVAWMAAHGGPRSAKPGEAPTTGPDAARRPERRPATGNRRDAR
ncbi:M23 family metallopeptidase [Longispora sp. K20-0274]|uniref:M23 family metallopeptidase n=1 Tax=Longispora sp. K20-0274 TaxID=3088255 RepID=UPI00399A5393